MHQVISYFAELRTSAEDTDQEAMHSRVDAPRFQGLKGLRFIIRKAGVRLALRIKQNKQRQVLARQKQSPSPHKVTKAIAINPHLACLHQRTSLRTLKGKKAVESLADITPEDHTSMPVDE